MSATHNRRRGNGPIVTIAEAAEKMNVSPQRAQQLEKRALRKLRLALYDLDPRWDGVRKEEEKQ